MIIVGIVFLLFLPAYGDTLETTDIDALLAEATEGDAIAQFNLGLCYHNGDGVEKDDEKAVEWYTKAAEQGHPDAQYTLGMVYGYPWSYEGVVQDFKKAVEWFALAAEQGHSEAQFILGLCYDMGNGVAQDFEKAVEWYTKAAEQGHTQAQYSLGLCYENGKGVAVDFETAVEWYTKAVESSKPDPYVQAQSRLNKLQTRLDRLPSR